MKTYLFLLSTLVFTFCSCTNNIREFYVSPGGNDNNPGTKGKPFLSFNKAKEAVNQMIADGSKNEEIHVYFREGTYFFDQTVVLNSDQFYSGNNKIIFSSYKSEKTVFSSAKLLTGWEKAEGDIPYLPETAKGKIWAINIPENGHGPVIARFLCTDSAPLVNAISDPFTTVESDSQNKLRSDFMGANYESPAEFSSVMFPENSLREWDNINDIEIVARPHYGWVVNILPLKKIDLKKHIAYTTIPATYFIYRLSGSGDGANPNLQIQNAIDYLDKPGEWVINSKEGKIYYWPEKGEPSNIYYPLLQELIRVEGNEEDNRVLKNIEFRGITFAHGDRDTWDNDDIGLQHDWALYDKSDALLRFVDTEGCMVDNCTFTTSGGGGVRFDFYSQNNKVSNCEFSHLGGTPVLLAGYGPGNKDVNRNNEIINNEIHHCGLSYTHSPGIFIWQSGGNRIAHNLIHHVPYSGIVISGPRPQFFNRRMGNRRELTGTFHYDNIKVEAGEDWNVSSPHIKAWDKLFPYLFASNNIIEYNELHDVMQQLDDGNAIYLSGTGYSNIVRKNYVHDNTSEHRQAAIRADDYAKDITFAENIIYKFARSGIVSKYDNYITNNYIIDYVPTEMVNGEIHRPLSFIYIAAWGPIKGGIIKNNIICQTAGFSAPFLQISLYKDQLTSLNELPKLSDCAIDSNLYYARGVPHSSFAQLEELRRQEVDKNSLVADPCFGGFEEAGFKLKINSPAFKLGIKQIDFNKMGLLKK